MKMLLLTTGGTIACVASEHGFVAALPGEKLLEACPLLMGFEHDIDVPRGEPVREPPGPGDSVVEGAVVGTDRLHAARARILRDLAFDLPRFGLLAVQVIRFDEPADVINPAFRFGTEQATADDAVFWRGIRGIAQAAEPIGLCEHEIVVE